MGSPVLAAAELRAKEKRKTCRKSRRNGPPDPETARARGGVGGGVVRDTCWSVVGRRGRHRSEQASPRTAVLTERRRSRKGRAPFPGASRRTLHRTLSAIRPAVAVG